MFSRRLGCPTSILRGHFAFNRGHASFHRLLPLRPLPGPPQKLLSGTLDVADPEADASGVGSDVDWRVEPMESQGALLFGVKVDGESAHSKARLG